MTDQKGDEMESTIPEVVLVGASEVRVAVQGSTLLPTADGAACCCCSSCCCCANRPK